MSLVARLSAKIDRWRHGPLPVGTCSQHRSVLSRFGWGSNQAYSDIPPYGPHLMLSNVAIPWPITLPCPESRPIAPGALRRILGDALISRKEYLRAFVAEFGPANAPDSGP